MTALEIRTCCRAAPGLPGREAVFVEPAGEPAVLAVGDVLEQVDVADLAPFDPAMAAHEGGHAVTQIVLGGAVLELAMRPNPVARMAEKLQGDAQVVMLLAGRVAQQWWRRWQVDVHPETLAENMDRVKTTVGGWCDECIVLRNLMSRHRERGYDYVRSEYRRLEALTNQIVRRPDVWRAIRQTADALMVDGTLDGTVVHEITDREVYEQTRATIRKEVTTCWNFCET